MPNPIVSTYSHPGALLSDLVYERSEKALTMAVHAYRNKTITPEQALAVIAEISGLRLLLSDLAERLKQ